jgi:hypothetical protein
MFAPRRAPRVALSALALVWLACNKSAPSANAPPRASLPPLGQRSPAELAADSEVTAKLPVGHAPMGELPAGHPPMGELPAGHPPMGGGSGSGAGGMGELPPGHVPVDEQATPGGIEFDPKSVVTGELRLDPKLAARVQAGDVVFLMARVADADGNPGPLVAVKKLTAGKWPAAFELDGRDAMMTGTKMEGRVVITARVDKDGDAISKNPGDVTGKSKAVTLPAQKVVVNLDTVL